ACRSVVEMVDRLLQIEEESLLFGPLLRNVGDRPGRKRLAMAWHLEDARPYPVPARSGSTARPNRLGKAELAAIGLSVAQARRKLLYGRGCFGIVRKQALDGLHVGGRSGSRHLG